MSDSTTLFHRAGQRLGRFTNQLRIRDRKSFKSVFPGNGIIPLRRMLQLFLKLEFRGILTPAIIEESCLSNFFDLRHVPSEPGGVRRHVKIKFMFWSEV